MECALLPGPNWRDASAWVGLDTLLNESAGFRVNTIATGSGVYPLARETISRATSRAEQDAEVVARSDVDSRDVTTALIDARQQVLYTRAGARMVSAANEMLGSIVDIIA